MKKSKLLASVAIAGMIMGAQVALADHHEEGAKEEQSKEDCKDKDKNACKGKKAAEAEHEHPAAPEKPKKQ